MNQFVEFNEKSTKNSRMRVFSHLETGIELEISPEMSMMRMKYTSSQKQRYRRDVMDYVVPGAPVGIEFVVTAAGHPGCLQHDQYCKKDPKSTACRFGKGVVYGQKGLHSC